MSPPPAAYAVALSLLPGAGPVSLGVLLAGGDPERAWDDVRSGRARRPPSRSATPDARRVGWDVASARIDVEAEWQRARRAGIEVTWQGRPDFPAALVDDPAPPPILFWTGSLAALARPCVALVGTRRATPEGRALAFDMARDLAEAGVCVVSGLALGIDGAAHRGALAAGVPAATVGIAASGCDRVYPTRHRALWEQVVANGAVLSETPPGRPAQTWRFPARNRIIAGLVSMVVVVESHAAGGSLITVEAALERGVEVRAVPGPVRSPASAGTNQLLYDGPGPVRDATDILVALGTAVPSGAGRSPAAPPPPRLARMGPTAPGRAGWAGARPTGDTTAVSAPAVAILEAVGWEPRTLNWIAGHAGTSVPVLAGLLDELVDAGVMAEERGWWQRLR